jgi:probable FeS assembly SUF system protein SufT
MSYGTEITLERNIEAIQIPYGQKLPLKRGEKLFVHQVLGGNFTVITQQGMMVRIDAQDVDALGEVGRQAQKEAQKDLASAPTPEIPKDMPAEQAEIVKQVWQLLRTCYDPEIPVNIVELGLIYEMQVLKLPTDGHAVNVKMSLTAPGCGMGPVLQQDAQTKLAAIPGVKAVNVEVVLDPPWDPSRMSEAARLQLGML